jgi:hypothetical protein
MIAWPYLELGIYAFLALVAGSIVAGRLPPFLTKATGWLATWWPVVGLGVVSAAVSWWMWKSLTAVPIVHDEAAYVLQAQIFARGMWAVPSPPLPHFFEQFHVLVSPMLAPKYPPGHAILLLPGIWLGLPGLTPVILNGLTGALLFALVRRLSNPWVGLLAWFLWLVAPASLFFRQSYFSEVSTGFLMLLAWWYLLDWRESGTMRSLLIVSAAVGWSAITRPLTALAFAVPIVIYVLWQGWQRGVWKQLVAGAAVGSVIVLLLPWQSLRVTGDWSLTPFRHYAELYLPFDVLGFGAHDSPPLRELPPDMVQLSQAFLPIHEAHTVDALPGTVLARVKLILHSTWGSWWVILAPLAAIALVGLSAEAGFALVSAALIVFGYLLYAHPPEWVLYYMEVQEVVVMITALGMWKLIQWLMRLHRRGATIPAGEAIARGGVALCAFILVVTPFKVQFINQTRDPVLSRGSQQAAFRDAVAGLPHKSVIFVRYARTHNIHMSLVTNVPDLEKAHAWIVYDRGAENVELLAEAGERTPYIFDEQAGRLLPMNPETGDIHRSAEPLGNQRPPETP